MNFKRFLLILAVSIPFAVVMAQPESARTEPVRLAAATPAPAPSSPDADSSRSTAATETIYTEGIHYDRIDPAQPVEAAAGKAQVAELFWYGCSHCFEFDPQIADWLKQKPAGVEFVRIPAVFRNNVWQLHAKAFYAAESLGVLERMHPALFAAIHEEHQPLRTEDELARFFAKHGVAEADFRAAFNSFAVETKVNRAMELSKRYGISGVPSIVVAGKYRVEGSKAGSFENMLKIAEYLARREARGMR